MLLNNWAGLIIHVLYMAWVSAAFYAAATWLPAQLRTAGMKVIDSQVGGTLFLQDIHAGLEQRRACAYLCNSPCKLVHPPTYFSSPLTLQGVVVISMLTNAAGLFICGTMFDKGVRAIPINAVVTTVGVGLGEPPCRLLCLHIHTCATTRPPLPTSLLPTSLPSCRLRRLPLRVGVRRRHEREHPGLLVPLPSLPGARAVLAAACLVVSRAEGST